MIKPLPGYILLEEVKEKAKTEILLSEDVDMERPSLAKVVDGESEHFKIGNIVLFKQHLFDNVKLNDVSLLIGKEEGVVAVITDFNAE